MSYKRGRTLGSMGQLFAVLTVDAGIVPAGAGQPAMLRTWGIPTGPGWRDRPGKWNMLLPPLLTFGLLDWLSSLIERWRS